MSIISRLEKKLEAIFEKAFTRVLRKKIEPVELAHELERKLEEASVTDVRVPYTANAYTIHINRSDFNLLKPFIPDLKEELEGFVEKKAESIGVALPGPSEVSFKVDASLKPGEIKILPEVKKDRLSKVFEEAEEEHTKVISVEEASRLMLQRVEAVIEDLSTGQRYKVTRFPFRIGRMEANDVVIDDPTVSRFHAEIFKDGRHYYIRDLESTNGTFVNGNQIRVKRLQDGDIITLGISKLRWTTAS
jgi:hypothetical protein